MGATKLMTAAGGGITLDAASTASDKTITVPARTGNMAVDGPAFSAYQNSAQSLTANVVTKIQFQAEEFDTNNNFDSTTNYRFTPTVAGYYQITSDVAPLTGAYVYAAIYKNGSEYKRGAQNGSGGAYFYSASVTGLVYCNGSTDYIEIYALSTTAQTLTANSFQTYFQGAMVRAA